LRTNRDWLGFWFMLPAAAFLLLFLVYPLGLGVWLSFTDARIGTPGSFIGIENYEWIIGDSKFQTAVFFTLLYTLVASAFKFAIGLYLALLLNQNDAVQGDRARGDPDPVHRADGAVGDRLLVDLRPAVLGDLLVAESTWAWIEGNIDFLGDAWNARWSVIFANVWRGVPFIAISLLAGLQTLPPSLYEAATLDGATRWQMFRYVTYPLLTPIIAVVMTFSVLFTFTDFQLIKVLTNGGPAGSTELMATMSYNTAILGSRIGEGSAVSTAMVPFLLAAIMVSWFGLQRRKWQQGRAMTEPAKSTALADASEGMSYLSTLPQRLVMLYLPLSLIVFVLLFPFYWMTMTAIKRRSTCSTSTRTTRSGRGIRPSSTSRRCCSRPTIHSGSGTRCSSPWRPPSCRSSRASSPPTPSRGSATAAPAGSAARSSSPTWCRPRSCSSRSPRWCSSTAFSTPPSR
jgi:multiple sugar transport system permease protein